MEARAGDGPKVGSHVGDWRTLGPRAEDERTLGPRAQELSERRARQQRSQCHACAPNAQQLSALASIAAPSRSRSLTGSVL